MISSGFGATNALPRTSIYHSSRHASCRPIRAHLAVHASQQQQQQQQQWTLPADDPSPTVIRRRSAFTYSPKPDQQRGPQGPQQPPNINSKPAAERRSAPSRRSAQQHVKPAANQQPPRQRQQELQPDPAADDLDALAAQAANVVTTNRSSASSSPVSPASGSLLPGPIHSIPAAQPFRLHPAAAVPANSKPRYSAVDKLHLTKEAASDIARRLRQAGPPRRGQPVLRVFRYGIDDLRLFKALDLAGLEGRVVVVDSMHFADVVLTARNKRTGKAVNLGVARRAAAAAGVPVVELRAVSAQRLLTALGPLLGMNEADSSSRSMASSGVDSMQQRQQQQWISGGVQGASGAVGFSDALRAAQALRTEPRFLRWDEVEGDGSEELLQLLWGAANSSATAGAVSSSVVGFPGVGVGAVATAGGGQGAVACAAAAAGGSSGAAASPAVLSPRWQVWCAAQSVSGCEGVFQAVRDADVEDMRDYMLPDNPTARAGERHRLSKPLRHYSRIRRRRLRRDLWLQQVPW